MTVIKADVVIIGSGLASLMAADILSVTKNVIIITKSSVTDSNSVLAQGGIAAAISGDDDWRDHFFDTIRAGCYHNDETMTEFLVRQGPSVIDSLINKGIDFDRCKDGSYALGKEGAHSRRRILHSGGDATGKELVMKLLARVKEKTTIIEHEFAIDILIQNRTCIGVYTKNSEERKTTYIAPSVILATGGIGQLYEVTSNSEQATGDGIAMAYRAGATIADMEFVQFHPTMLVKSSKGIGLVSEAVRGEGARIVTEKGDFLMAGKHPLEDLAPRDVVARAINEHLCKNELLYLDISNIEHFTTRFPSIATMCEKASIDLKHHRIPIAPGAHFMMGGVVTNEKGETSIPGLYAVGEVARTGVHGANRLASNSLLECVVFAAEIAKEILRKQQISSFFVPATEKATREIGHLPSELEIKEVMTKGVGIVRTRQSLKEALSWFTTYRFAMLHLKNFTTTLEQQKICNMLTVGYLIALAAWERTESRGGHYRTDYPNSHERKWKHKTIYFSGGSEKPLVTTNCQEKLSV